MCTKYEADLLCQNLTYITTKGRGVGVTHPMRCGQSDSEMGIPFVSKTRRLVKELIHV